ncbi:MAG: HPF/RaiA family ribosome-associated protein, partial [Planctomycetota bacterium]
PVSDTVEAACWDEAAKLERDFEHITSCRIAVAESHNGERKGHVFEIRIVLNVPGDELAVTREPPAQDGNEDILAAIREAFDAARRQLEEYIARRQREAHLKS